MCSKRYSKKCKFKRMFADQEIPMMHFVDSRKFLLFSNRNLSKSHKFSPLPMRQCRPPPLSDLSRTEYDPKRYLCIIPCRRAWALISNFHAPGAQRNVFFSSSTITRKSSQSQLGVNKCLLLVKKEREEMPTPFELHTQPVF